MKESKFYVCEKCGTNLVLHEDLDTYSCDKCDEWKDTKCKDADCHYCSKRPAKPNQHKQLQG